MLFFASCPSSLYEILLKASPPTPQLPLPSSPPILTDDAIRLDRAHAYRLPLTLLPLVNPNSPRSTPARLQSPPIPFPAPRRYPGYPLIPVLPLQTKRPWNNHGTTRRSGFLCFSDTHSRLVAARSNFRQSTRSSIPYRIPQ